MKAMVAVVGAASMHSHVPDQESARVRVKVNLPLNMLVWAGRGWMQASGQGVGGCMSRE